MTQFGSGFHFISTVLDLEMELPVDITPNITLDRPTKSQLEVIKTTLAGASAQGMLSPNRFYENNFSFNVQGATTNIIATPLPPEQSRYYVLNFNQNNCTTHVSFEMYTLLNVADFIYPYLASFYHWLTDEEYGKGKVVGYGIDPYAIQSFYALPHPESPKILNSKSINRLQSAFDAYQSLEKTRHEGIIRAIEYHSNLKKLNATNRLPVLGLFMIIEMLLTHNPNDKEIGDSLTHQIKTKIALLSSRFSEPLNYDSFGKEANHERIWSSLYHFRSCIAHGNNIDFTEKRLKILRDDKAAYTFLSKATKQILEHSLKEPDLINSLKPI
jgi:hypothetical protein